MVVDELELILRREAIYTKMKVASETFAPGRVVLIVMLEGEAHVQIEAPGAEELEQVYETGQKALYALASFLERYRPELERKKAQQA